MNLRSMPPLAATRRSLWYEKWRLPAGRTLIRSRSAALARPAKQPLTKSERSGFFRVP
jgi:hypothetical protein